MDSPRTALVRFIPNGLSVARLALGLAFPLIPDTWRPWAVAAAVASDALDGLAARWLRVVSRTGQMLDPIADKVFVLMLAGTLVIEGTIQPRWALAIAARDLAVLAGLAVFTWRRQWSVRHQLKPNTTGKCATAGQFAVLWLLVSRGHCPIWVLVVTAIVSALAAAGYAVAFVRLLRTSRG